MGCGGSLKLNMTSTVQPSSSHRVCIPSAERRFIKVYGMGWAPCLPVVGQESWDQRESIVTMSIISIALQANDVRLVRPVGFVSVGAFVIGAIMPRRQSLKG